MNTIEKIKYVMENDSRVYSTDYTFDVDDSVKISFYSNDGSELHSILADSEDNLESIDAEILKFFNTRR